MSLTLSLRPITSRIGSRYFGTELAAVESVEISPENRRYRPAAIALPDEIERVTLFP